MPPTEIKEPTLLERLHEQRTKLVEKWSSFVDAREQVETEFEARQASDAKPTEDEINAHGEARVAYRAEADQLEAEVKEFDLRIQDQDNIEKRRNEAAEAAKPSARSTVGGREPLTYERHKAVGENRTSYYADLAVALVPGFTLQMTNQADATQRLGRHADEMRVELPKRAKEREERARRQFEDAEGERAGWYDPYHRNERFNQIYNPFEQRVEPNSTDGQGGYFVPPLWLVDEYIPGLRAHLIAAGLCRQMDLPPGTDSINIPKLANLTAVGYQQANNAGLPSADWSDTVVTGNVKTIGGYSDVALQLLEQSPNQIVDEVVTTDLMAAYNKFLDQQVVAGDGLNTGNLNGGHLLGIYPTSNTWAANGVTYTDGSPAPWKFPSVLGAMASQVAETRFDAQNYKVVLHGRRWFWFSTGPDGNDRPLGETVGGGRYNVAAAVEAGLQAEGLVGTLPFLSDAPVYIDDNVPTNDNNGTPLTGSADVAIAGLWDDAWLFKGDLRTNVYREILSGSLGVRFQVYNYAAFLLRYGQSFAVATGTGFSAPQGAVTSVLF